ncbi:MAG: response regulator [Chloroflexi bacterium]|nr:MAG: response regulator [Chloroflexota bacterium]
MRGVGNMGETSVLVIEDDKLLAEMYRQYLTADGHSVCVALDGEAGLIAAQTQLPSVIYLDLQLPKLNGVEVLERLRLMPDLKDIPVIILSNFSEPRLRQRCLMLGAVDYLVKAETRLAQVSQRARQVAAG